LQRWNGVVSSVSIDFICADHDLSARRLPDGQALFFRESAKRLIRHAKTFGGGAKPQPFNLNFNGHDDTSGAQQKRARQRRRTPVTLGYAVSSAPRPYFSYTRLLAGGPHNRFLKCALPQHIVAGEASSAWVEDQCSSLQIAGLCPLHIRIDRQRLHAAMIVVYEIYRAEMTMNSHKHSKVRVAVKGVDH
jgi:hypothetical protein